MTTTLINTGPGGTWTIDAPEGVTLATSQDTQGITTGLKIFVDYTYAQYINPNTAIHFVGPVPENPTGTPLPGQFFPGLILQTTFALRNDLGVPIEGLSINLKNDGAPAIPGRDNKNAHPDDYAHFHQLTPTSLTDRQTGRVDTFKIFDPTFQPADFGPALINKAAPSNIFTTEFIQPDAILDVKGANAPDNTFTLHSENTPGPSGGSFTLSWFALETNPVAPPATTVRIFPTPTGTPIEFFDHQADGKDFILAGTSPTPADLTAIEFHFATTNAPNSISLAGSTNEPSVFGDIKLDSDTKTTATNGIKVTHGLLTVHEDPTATFVLGGDSTLDHDGRLTVESLVPNKDAQVTLNGNLTLTENGFNVADIGARLNGNGMVFLHGVGDLLTVNEVGNDIKFDVGAGILSITKPTSFHGTITAAPEAPSIGPSGTLALFNTADVTHATFETSKGLLHLLNQSGMDRGDIHFSGNASGLVLTRPTGPGPDSFIAVTDNGNTGTIPLTFT